MHEITQRRILGPVGLSLATLRFWLIRLKTRRRLAQLDAAALADVGITEAERQRECAKWFWQD